MTTAFSLSESGLDSPLQAASPAATVFSILPFTEAWKPSGFFIKEEPPSTIFKCQQVNRKCSSHTVHSLVILGVTPPMLAFAHRVANTGTRIHLVELTQRPKPFKRPMSIFEPDGITLAWSSAEAGVGTDGGLAAIEAFAERVRADALLTSDDFTLAWLGKNRSRFEPRCTVLAPDPTTLERLWDKSHQTSRAAQCGFDVLPGWELASPEDIAAIPTDGYPVVIRPSYPNSAQPGFKARVLATANDLCQFYSSTHWTHPPIVQRFCLGPNYVLHGMRAQTGEFLDWRLFKAYRKYHGFATSIEPAPLPVHLESAARQFIQAEGLTGAFHFDLLRAGSDNRFYFLEINCRLGGTTGKVVQLGYDEPGLLLAAFNLETPKPLRPLRAFPRTTSLSLNLLQAWNELRNRRDPLAYPQMPRVKSIFAALKEALFVHKG